MMSEYQSTGWEPPRPRPDLRPRADRRAQAVATATDYLLRLAPRDVARWASPWAAQQLRRHGPKLIAWVAEAIAALPERRRP